MASPILGNFVWYELTTPDIAAAERFYGSVLGWRAEDAGMEGMRYSLLNAGDTRIAGMMAKTDDAPAGWLGYVAVDDVTETLPRIQRDGGQVIFPMHDIPGVGRFAILSDPQGGVFAVMDYAEDFQPPPLPDAPTHGHGMWRELYSTDREAAFGFYHRQFGWSEAARLDIGPMGIYQVIASGERQIGGMLGSEMPLSYWLFYFWVDDIDLAHRLLVEGGGQALDGPREIPGGSWIIRARDPQGITFALIGARR